MEMEVSEPTSDPMQLWLKVVKLRIFSMKTHPSYTYLCMQKRTTLVRNAILKMPSWTPSHFVDPDFTGTALETGSGAGAGFNHNIPLPEGVTGDDEYFIALQSALGRIDQFEPAYLVVRCVLNRRVLYNDDLGLVLG